MLLSRQQSPDCEMHYYLSTTPHHCVIFDTYIKLKCYLGSIYAALTYVSTLDAKMAVISLTGLSLRISWHVSVSRNF